MKRAKWIAAPVIALSAVALTTGTADASTAHGSSSSVVSAASHHQANAPYRAPLGVNRAPLGVMSPDYLQCSKIRRNDSTYEAECFGDQTWRLGVYCDFPSPSPVYSPWFSGFGFARVSCWFGTHAQYSTIEF